MLSGFDGLCVLQCSFISVLQSRHCSASSSEMLVRYGLAVETVKFTRSGNLMKVYVEASQGFLQDVRFLLKFFRDDLRVEGIDMSRQATISRLADGKSADAVGLQRSEAKKPHKYKKTCTPKPLRCKIVEGER